ncbi:MAG: siderophore-interacting protein [Nocardioides sp.]|uniref:siderophore-interacting protein n=1 Tax=Nocardioides sp. TaxID=35761 RepID=UPI003F0228D1
MTSTQAPTLPFVLAEVTVASVERLSPSFVRLELAGEGLADVGLDEAGERGWWDQRFKLVVPDPSGGLTSVEGADESWLGTWLERPVEERGHMRTYTLRELRGTGPDTRVVLDVVLHPGASGPGADWAAAAAPGSRAVVLMPRRGSEFGGIEFLPPSGARLLLVGDETAVPAICAILEQLPLDATGAAFMEVPVDGDVLDVRAPVGVDVTWLVRGGREHGTALTDAVLAHLGARGEVDAQPEVADADPEPWETPTYSSSGEEIEQTAGPVPGDYAWIAGESSTVTGLRRHLVKGLGMDRRQVAFMGYWRRGVSMRS